MLVQPSAPRFSLVDAGDRTRIVLPSRKVWYVLAFLGFWLSGWTCGEVSALTTLLSGRATGGPTPFLLFWLVGWTVGGAMALFTFLWQLAGSETLEISGDGLAVWHSLFGLHLPPKVYAAHHIHDLRVPVLDAPPPFGVARTRFVWGLGPGAVAFDYGAKTIRIASGADEAEAKLIVAAIRQRYPAFGHAR